MPQTAQNYTQVHFRSHRRRYYIVTPFFKFQFAFNV